MERLTREDVRPEQVKDCVSWSSPSSHPEDSLSCLICGTNFARPSGERPIPLSLDCLSHHFLGES